MTRRYLTFRELGRAPALLVGAAMLIVILGWYVGRVPLTRLALGSTAVKPNTAVGLGALAVALILIDRGVLALALSCAAVALAAATLLEYLVGISLGVDILLPGASLEPASARMAPGTAVAIGLLGIAVALGAVGRASLMRALGVVAFAVGQVAVLGYAYQVPTFYTVGGLTRMALPTALCVVLLSLSIQLIHPESGLAGLLSDRGSAGRLLRLLVPFLLFGPGLLGWLALRAQDVGWFDARFGVGALITCVTGVGCALSWRVGTQLRELDRARDQVARAQTDANRSLEAIVDERTRELANRQRFTDGLLETIEIGIVFCDAEGANFIRNRAERALFNLPATTAKGMAPSAVATLYDVLDRDGHAIAVEDYPLLRALRGDSPGAVELLLGPAGGPHRQVISHNSQILGVDGVLLGAVSALTDVSTEREAARELAAERRALTEAQRLAQLGSFTYDIGSRTYTYSEQLLRIWGLAPDADVRPLASELIHPDDRERFAEHWEQALSGAGHTQFECRIVRNGNETRYLRSDLERAVGPDLGPVIVGTHLDITELTRAQNSALRANNFFEAVLTATPDYTFVTDVDTGDILYGSASKDVLGMSSEQLQALGSERQALLVHPEDVPRLRAANRDSAFLADGEVAQTRHRCRHVDGEWRWLSRRVTPFARDETGQVTQVLGVVRDITDVVLAEDQLTHGALHDSLTGLPNRALLIDRLNTALARLSRDGREVAVLFCDLDGFKRVNDTGGHAAGDAVLVEVAHRLSSVLRDGDTVARVGGDEFVVIVEPWNRKSPTKEPLADESGNQPHRVLAVQFAQRIGDALRQPIMVGGIEHVVTASIGLTYASLEETQPGGTPTADAVLQDADAAMYRAKWLGKDRFSLFEHDLRTDRLERGRVEHVLRQAIQSAGGAALLPVSAAILGPTLTANYQPIFSADSGALVGFEALARLTDLDGVGITPDVFIAVAEETGLIHALGGVMLELACGQLAAWRHENGGLETATMAINVSGLQAQHATLGDDVRRVMGGHHLRPSDVILELTETALLQAAQTTIDALRTLRAEGVGIAIDDFGIGYSSLRYLATLPVSAIKIDKSFTGGLPYDETSRKIVKAVAGLAAELDLACIVEGVETLDQRLALPYGVQLQGWLTGRAEPADQLDISALVIHGVSAR